MKSYPLIHQLLTLVEQLEEEHKGDEVSLQDFAGFLINHIGGLEGYAGQPGLAPEIVAAAGAAALQSDAKHSVIPENGDVRFGKNEDEAQEIAYQLDNNIGRLFVYMSRYAKSYIKKALEGTPLQTGEEFTALAILLTHTQLSKTELISHNLQEKTSGSEVIRRLIAARLVRQWDNEHDKRGKYIGITEEGKTLLYQVFQDMNHVGKMITGQLNFAEKLTLQYLLQKLEDFHYAHHEKKTILSKEDLKTFTETQV